MINLRNLVGKYVMRNKPVILDTDTFSFTLKKDYSFTRFDENEMWFCEAIRGDTPILLNKITGKKIVISTMYDDDNWKDVTDVVNYLDEGENK